MPDLPSNISVTAKDNPEIIVAGHICLDLLPTFDKTSTVSTAEMFTPGKLVQIGESVLSSGGTVSNTGIALRQLGFSTGLMAKIGNDLFGQGLLKILESFSDDLQLIVDTDSSTSYSYVIAPPGVDRVFLHHPGANDTFCSQDLNYDNIAKAKLFHFGYPPVMKHMYEHDGRDLGAMMKQIKDRNVITSLDMAYPDPDSPGGHADWIKILHSTLPFTDIFLPSIEELLFMIDRHEFDRLSVKSQETGISFIQLFDMNNLPELADILISFGSAVVVIKMGSKGLYMKTANEKRMRSLAEYLPIDLEAWSDKSWFAPSFLVQNIASTTGAGDASIAGFLAGILLGRPAWQSLQLGCGAAAQKIQIRKSFGGIDPVESLLNKISDWPHEKVANIPADWNFDEDKRIWRIQ